MNTKTLIYFVVIALFTASCLPSTQAQNVGISATGVAPDASAMLDINSDSSGILIPRVSLTDTADQATITSPATSIIVYNANAAMTGGNGAGLYQWNGNKWVNLIAPPNSPGDSGQVLTSQGTAQAPMWKTAASSGGGGSCFTNFQLFTSGGTFTVPAGVTTIKVEVVGGGGGISVGIFTVTSGTNYTVTIGSGGAGGAPTVNTKGGSGGTSSFIGTGINMTATGGGGGTSGAKLPGTGGVGSGGYYNHTLGGGGGSATADINAINGENGGGAAGADEKGGGGGGGAGGGRGGATIYGASSAKGGNALANSGAGGGGGVLVSFTNYAGGNGAAGRVVVFW